MHDRLPDSIIRIRILYCKSTLIPTRISRLGLQSVLMDFLKNDLFKIMFFYGIGANDAVHGHR